MSLGPLMVDVAGTELTSEDLEILEHPLVGSVILFTRNYRNPQQISALCGAIRDLRNPHLLIAVDHEGGRVQRFREGFTRLPPLRVLGRRYDEDRRDALGKAHFLGWLMAAELRAVGVDFSFAPCVDLDYGLSEIIGDRAFHRDPQAVAALATAYMAGMREAGMAAIAKHFPGHGAVRADSHLALPVDRRPLADMEARSFPVPAAHREPAARHHGGARRIFGGRPQACEPVAPLDHRDFARQPRLSRMRIRRRSQHGGRGGVRRRGRARAARAGRGMRRTADLQ